MASTSKIGHGKYLKRQAHEIVYTVFKFVMEKSTLVGKCLPMTERYTKTSDATGVSQTRIRQIVGIVKQLFYCGTSAFDT